MITIKDNNYNRECIEKLIEIFEDGILTSTAKCYGRCKECKAKYACMDCTNALKYLYQQLDSKYKQS